MMRGRAIALAAPFALLLAGGCASAGPVDSRAVPAGAASVQIDTTRMSETVKVLASDAFEGRAPGTPGEEKSVAYLSQRFQELGLEPGGENGGWTQIVPMIRTQMGAGSASVALAGRTLPLEVGKDIYLGTIRPVEQARIADAPVVFVGYGVTAPERGWDDFKGADLKGKVALFLVNDPDFEAMPSDPVAGRFGGRAMTYYGRWSFKFEEAARRGAIAALVIHQTDGAGYGWNTVVAPGGESYDIVRPADAVSPPLLQGWLEGETTRRLFRAAGLDFEALKVQARSADFRPVELPGARLSADFKVDLTRFESRNVLARLTGKARPDETIMYGGHWDAFGVGAPDAQGRTVRPGANDDALGLAGILEIARAFKAGPRPDRTIVFAAWTGEERGLLGSEYYAVHPLYPVAKTVANITLDVLQTAGPARDVILIGQGQDSLEDDLARAAAAQGRTVTPDSSPERGLFYRADHFPMAKRGIPVLLLMGLGGGADLAEGGRAAGEKWVNDFTAHCYHQTCDAWSPDWDLRGAAQDVALAYEIGRDLAFSDRWPSWKEGSEFKAVREKSAAERR